MKNKKKEIKQLKSTVLSSDTLDKLIKKVMSNKLQVYIITSNFLHPNQLGGIRQQLTTNTGIFLTYLIQIEQVKKLYTSILEFDIT